VLPMLEKAWHGALTVQHLCCADKLLHTNMVIMWFFCLPGMLQLSLTFILICINKLLKVDIIVLN